MLQPPGIGTFLIHVPKYPSVHPSVHIVGLSLRRAVHIAVVSSAVRRPIKPRWEWFWLLTNHFLVHMPNVLRWRRGQDRDGNLLNGTPLANK
jgi:hypothetical protein